MLSISHFLLAFIVATPSVRAQSSTTVCTQTGCNQDNCYRNLVQSTAFCASFTAPPQSGATPTTASLNSIQSSCGVTRLSSACSCLYPSGATTLATKASITQCTTLPLAPSPTALSVNFESDSQAIYVGRTYNVNNYSIISNPSLAHSPPNLFRVTFTPEAPGDFTSRNVYLFATGLMRPFTDYTFTFWARADALTDPNDSDIDYINLIIQGLKKGPAPPDLVLTESPSTFSNRLLTPAVDTTWRRYTGSFNSGEWPYFYIQFYFNNGGYSFSGVVPSLYIDDVSLVQA
ncbi:hypothetical protein F5B22DRAFT_619744 [Xylaria bambusicola]|uniref:uncharacterized protein n=1 Tax=Xylaria bambusicola TaxID=326684 RepID=UPI00200858F9|nr:uncharacterized protein F5B22DRAFT_619744 [Xylaria bambusicola]KAI0508824.1 hypothetical protein F5B22DRAFT_619744 [Xylaria bambusicola]